MKPASVIIMDEHPIVRMSIEVLLQKNKNIEIKLKSGDSHETLEYMRNHLLSGLAPGRLRSQY
jgi:two-component system response regulator FimZ (fimbrial Z protein)